jgi:hypothetical protein
MAGRDRRALRVGAGLVVVAFIVLRGGPLVVREVRAAEGRLTAAHARLGATQHESAALPGLEDSARAVRAALVGIAPALLEGGTPAGAAGALSLRLTAMADRSGVRLERTTALEDSARVGRLARVRARAEVESDSRGIVALLSGIERDPAALRVVDLKVTALDPLSGDERAELLRAELTLTGWYAAGDDE